MFLIDHLIRVANLFFSNNYLFVVLFVISLIALAVGKMRDADSAKSMMVFTLITLLVIFFPLSSVVFNRFLDGDPVFARLWMICPVWIVIAYVMASRIIGVHSKVIKSICVIVLAGLVIVTGSNLKSLNMINNADSVYKIRHESVEISDEILMLNNGNPTSLFILVPINSVPDNFVEGGTIRSGIEQYTGNIELYGFGCSDEFWSEYFLSDVTPTNRESEEWINAFVNERHAASGAEYFAFPTNDIVDRKLANLGFVLTTYIGGYSIYKI